MELTRHSVATQFKDYVMIVLGLACFSFGFTAFILPEKIVTGGVAGVASIFDYALGWNVAVVNFAINVLLLLIAYKTVDHQFVVRTIIGAALTSLFIGLMRPLFVHPIVEQQPFMNVVLGAVLCGLGMGTTFAHNGSTAGTDIIAAMVTKHNSNVSFGRMMFYCDVCIVSSSYLLFGRVDKVVYGVVFLLINSVVSDMAINSTRQSVQFLIISEKWEDIANAINNVANRGCTLIHGTGWYSKHDVKMLLVLCRKIESVNIFRIIKSIDPDAFISQANVNGVYGKGFDTMRVRLHKFKPKMGDENAPLDEDSASVGNDPSKKQ